MKKDTKFKKGLIPWNKGKPYVLSPEQTKRRIAALPRGEKHHMFGKTHSEETIKKISIGRSGKKTGPFTEDHRKNMVLGAKNRKRPPAFTEEHKRNLSQARIGKVISEETRRKIGKSNWKNGLTPLYLRIRHSYEYRQWVLAIFKRDKYACVICKIGGKLNADHIKPFSHIIKENNISSFEEALVCVELWDIKNGRTLCIPHHKATDTYGKKAKKYA